ncbi:12S rRNA N4-methylcytidine (m4C) methyltransferase isoform X2 [Ahaetulla prasina]|uniref:12S rRNA N4-methylcytidine (m4C) methyltransferase isoform X2 n=1 Tax=Ahaetulla prasina TaxID=499056 RepID=UPI0026487484|nr:12S rRNA N4-methylcytidine (m4C) methyltransferase isoform X2 [Ahaetulla prasina]
MGAWYVPFWLLSSAIRRRGVGTYLRRTFSLSEDSSQSQPSFVWSVYLPFSYLSFFLSTCRVCFFVFPKSWIPRQQRRDLKPFSDSIHQSEQRSTTHAGCCLHSTRRCVSAPICSGEPSSWIWRWEEVQQIQPLLGSFSQAEALLTSSGVQPASLDGILLDAGCSSLQLDTPERGFSLKKDGPLDMRMDGDRYPDTPTAADVVNALDQQALASILKTYGEEKHAKKIASTIVQARSIYPITRTRQLASIIAGAFPETILYARKDKLSRPAHIATKTFQALRIFVNNELHELYEGLKAAERFLKPGGRLVAITFHSLEDRIVKRFLHGVDISERFNLSVRQKIRRARMDLLEGEDESLGENCSSKWKLIEKKVLTPQDTEIKNNPRGRSAKLRGAIKL